MSTLTGIDYLLEHASFSDKEAREKTEARIKPLLDAANNCAGMTHVLEAIDGDHDDRIYFGMEKGE